MKMPQLDRRVWWSFGAIALAGTYAFSRRTRGFDRIAPELQSTFSRFRTPSIGPVLLPIMQALTRNPSRIVDGVKVESRTIAGPAGPITVYIYLPHDVRPGGGAMLYSHGGGTIIGSAPGYHRIVSSYARDLGIVVVSADYRLAPQHPFPAPLDDVYAAYLWLIASSDMLGVDPGRIVVAGESAGGCLSAALCQRVRDAGDPAPVFQMLIYPMLDDRTVTRAADEFAGQILSTPKSNRYSWACYLGYEPGTVDPAPYAVPARCENLSDLPSAWVGVGTLDLFHDETVRYAHRLNETGVDCEAFVARGAFHGFDELYPDTKIAKAFRGSALDAVRRAMAAAR